MIKLFKAFKKSDEYYVVFDFNSGVSRLVKHSEVSNTASNEVLIKEDIQNAWCKESASLGVRKEDGGIPFVMFVKDMEGKFHRLTLVAKRDGSIERSSLVLGTNDKLLKSEFGEGLL